VLHQRQDGEIQRKVYQLSKGNPIVDTKELFRRPPKKQVEDSRAAPSKVLGVGTTGYAKDILKRRAPRRRRDRRDRRPLPRARCTSTTTSTSSATSAARTSRSSS
jgi:hypothetical protein